MHSLTSRDAGRLVTLLALYLTPAAKKMLETTMGKNSFETRKNSEDDVNFYFLNF